MLILEVQVEEVLVLVVLLQEVAGLQETLQGQLLVKEMLEVLVH
jgi:hypothetical protein